MIDRSHPRATSSLPSMQISSELTTP